jgi:hypothetical protein
MANANSSSENEATDDVIAPANGTVRAVRQHRPTNPNAAGVAATEASLNAPKPVFNQEWADEAWAAMVPWILRGGPGPQSARLEDVNMGVVRREADGSEARIGLIRGHHVAGAPGSGVGDGGPGQALFRRLAEVHMSHDRPAIYDVTFTWKQSGQIITKKPMSFPFPRELAGMMKGLGAGPTGGPNGGYDPNRGPALDYGNGYPSASAIPSIGGYPNAPGVGNAYGQGGNDAIMQMSREMREMQQRHYDEMRAMSLELGRPPPAPPPGVAAPPPPSAEFLAMKQIVEQQSAMIKTLTEAMPKPPPPPDPKAQFAREVVTEIFSALGVKPQIGPDGKMGFAGLPAVPAGPPPRPMTALEAVNKRVADATSLVEARDVLNASLAQIGVSGIPEATAELAEPEEKPEDALPFKITKIPTPSGIFGQQEYNLTSAKEGEIIGLGQSVVNQWLANPGMQERTIEVAGKILEKIADPLMGFLTKLGEATKPGQQQQQQQAQVTTPAAPAQMYSAPRVQPQGPPPVVFDDAPPAAPVGTGAPPAVAWGDD